MKKLALWFSLLPFAAFAQQQFSEPRMILPNHSNDLEALSVSSAGFIASSSLDRLINIYKDDSTYALVKTLPVQLVPVTALRFSKDGKLLASGCSGPNANSINLWDSTFKHMRQLDGHTGNINALLFDNTRKYLFSGSDDKSIRVWDIATGKQIRMINHNQAVHSMVQNPLDLRQFIVAGAEPQIKIYSLANNQVAKTLDGHSDIVNAVDVSRTGGLLISGSNDKSARIWDLKTGKEIRKLPVDCWKVTAVAFSDDAKYALTGCNDGSVKVWEVATGKLVSSIDGKGNYVKDIGFSKTTNDVLVADMIKDGSAYGVHVWKSGIESPKKNTPAGAQTSENKKDSTLNSPAKTAPRSPLKPSPATPKK